MTGIKIPVVLVSGLSGAGKASILRALEDIGFNAVDNPPLDLIETLATRLTGKLAIGVDCRSRGFDAVAVLDVLARLRANSALAPELLYATAGDAVLQRRFTETRRRHPLAPQGRVSDGVAAEQILTAPLHEAADLVIDTSDLPLGELRRLVELRYSEGGAAGMVVFLVSFAFSAGLPREADLVFDARFLRNPHYDPILRSRTGLDPAVGAYIAADPDYDQFVDQLCGMIRLVLPRFVQEGKKYATIGIGCTGGRHRSVHLIETLAETIRNGGWNLLVTHRELARNAAELAAPRPSPHSGLDSGPALRQEARGVPSPRGESQPDVGVAPPTPDSTPDRAGEA